MNEELSELIEIELSKRLKYCNILVDSVTFKSSTDILYYEIFIDSDIKDIQLKHHDSVEIDKLDADYFNNLSSVLASRLGRMIFRCQPI